MPKIFISAALFTFAEQAFNRLLRDELVGAGHEVTLPQEFEHEIHEKELFVQCIEAVQSADLVIAVVDGAEVDAGVGFEMGVAWSKEIPVIALRTDFRRRAETIHGGLNLMLQYGATQVIEADGDPFKAAIEAVTKFFGNEVELVGCHER